MKAEELMIRDWIYNTHNLQNEQVAEIGSGLVMLAYNDLYEYDEIEPIPLTPDILEKNGFEKDYSSILTAEGFKKLPVYKYKNMKQAHDVCHNLIKVCVSLDGSKYDVEFGIGSHIFDLEFVHQLQHALRICGIEKEITL